MGAGINGLNATWALRIIVRRPGRIAFPGGSRELERASSSKLRKNAGRLVRLQSRLLYPTPAQLLTTLNQSC